MNIFLFIYLIVGIISAIIYTSLLVIADKCMDLPEAMNKQPVKKEGLGIFIILGIGFGCVWPLTVIALIFLMLPIIIHKIFR